MNKFYFTISTVFALAIGFNVAEASKENTPMDLDQNSQDSLANQNDSEEKKNPKVKKYRIEKTEFVETGSENQENYPQQTTND